MKRYIKLCQSFEYDYEYQKYPIEKGEKIEVLDWGDLGSLKIMTNYGHVFWVGLPYLMYDCEVRIF